MKVTSETIAALPNTQLQREPVKQYFAGDIRREDRISLFSIPVVTQEDVTRAQAADREFLNTCRPWKEFLESQIGKP